MKEKKDDSVSPEQSSGSSLEKSLARLDEIINRMEEANLPLEDLLRDYEEGARLVRDCQEHLAAAEKRILVVTKTLDGSVELEEFEPAKETPA